MTVQSDYAAGTITLTNGSAAFSGSGTAWQTAPTIAGDFFFDIAGASGNIGVISTITGEGAGILTKNWEGPTLSGVAYRLRFQSDGSRVLAEARNLIELLGGPALSAIGDLTPASDEFVYYNSATVAALGKVTAAARTLLNDISTTAMLATLGGLAKTKNLSDVEDATASLLNLGGLVKTDIRRNRINNSCMQVSQENGNTAGSASGYYMADRWSMVFSTNNGVISGQRIQDKTLAGALDRLRVSVTTADTAQGAGEYLAITHMIEGREIADAQFGTAGAIPLVVRFLGKFPAGTYTVALRNAANDRSFVREIIAVAGVDTVYTVTFPGDTTGSWPTANVAGVSLTICMASGSTYRTTADAWQAGNYFATSSIASSLQSIQSFDIGDVGMRLDPDSIGSYGLFEVPDAAAAEMDCFRYYWKGTVAALGWLYAGSGATSYKALELLFPVPMRATPSFSSSGTSTSNFTISAYDRDRHGFSIRGTTAAAGQYRITGGTYIANARM